MYKYQKMQQGMKKILWKGRFLMEGAFMSVIGFGMNALEANAATSKDKALDYSFIKDASMKNASIDGVTDKIKGVGASGYRLMSVLCVCAFFICGGLAMFRLMVHKNGQKREDTKDWVTYILFALAGFSALGFIFAVVQSFAGGFNV